MIKLAAAELAEMPQDQREALCGFILAFATNTAPVSNSLTDALRQSVADNGVSVDKAGLPWDERIHASTKALTADGLWRKKRGVEEPFVGQVEAQLRQLMSVPSAPVATSAPVPSPIALVPPPPPPTPVVEQSAKDIAASLLAPPPPPPPTIDPKAAWDELIRLASTSIRDKKMTQEELSDECRKVGIEQFTLLQSRIDLAPTVLAYVQELLQDR